MKQSKTQRATTSFLAALAVTGLLAGCSGEGDADGGDGDGGAEAEDGGEGFITDEWQRPDLFAMPPPNLPPSLSAWLLLWFLALATPTAAATRRGRPGTGAECASAVRTRAR